MKFIALLCIVLGGIYYYHSSNAPKQITNYQDLLIKAARTDVKVSEIKLASNVLALEFCNDESFQASGGKSPRECLRTYSNMRSMCEQRIFKNENDVIESKQTVVRIAKRYTACVGIE